MFDVNQGLVPLCSEGFLQHARVFLMLTVAVIIEPLFRRFNYVKN